MRFPVFKVALRIQDAAAALPCELQRCSISITFRPQFIDVHLDRRVEAPRRENNKYARGWGKRETLKGCSRELRLAFRSTLRAECLAF